MTLQFARTVTDQNPFLSPFSAWQMKTCHPHVLNRLSFVELAQDCANPFHEIGANPASVVAFEQPFKTLMPKAGYHPLL
jgi:hypothetical protein